MNARNHHGIPVNLNTLTEAATTDTAAVVSFATAMASKLFRAQQKGRAGWDDPTRCTTESLQRALQEHVAKGDPVDVANYAMMLFARGAGTAIPDSLNILAVENMQMRQALRAVLDEVSPGCTPISIDSSLPRSVIDQVDRAAALRSTAAVGVPRWRDQWEADSQGLGPEWYKQAEIEALRAALAVAVRPSSNLAYLPPSSSVDQAAQAVHFGGA